MCPPDVYPTLSLMSLAGTRDGRGWMVPDPDREPPNWHDDLPRLVQIFVGIAVFLAWIAILQGQGA